MLEKFAPLLERLNTDYFTKPMQPEVCDPDNPGSLAQRQLATQMYSPAIEYNGIRVERSNHGLVHTIRSMHYVGEVINYLLKYGKPELVNAIPKSIDKQESYILKLMLCMAFSSIGRESEIDWSVEPATHEYYRKRACAIFAKLYSQYKDPTAEHPELEMFSIFDSEQEFYQFQKSLLAMGDPDNVDPDHIIMNICHKLDLYRCREKSSCQTSVESYIRRFSQGDYGKKFARLIQFAKSALYVTGEQNKADNKSMVLSVFSDLCISVNLCISFLSYQHSLEMEDFDKASSEVPSIPPELADGFFYKSIRADNGDFWDEFCESVTKSPLNNEREAIRVKREKDGYNHMTLRLDPKSKSWKSDNVLFHPPLFTRSKKQFYSSANPVTYAHPNKSFEGPVFGWNRDRSDTLVGVIIKKEDVLINRIFNYDCGTYLRPYEGASKKIVEEKLSDGLNRKIFFNDYDKLIESGETYKINETLAYVKKISAIAIFSDNVISKLIAIARQKTYMQRLKHSIVEGRNDEVEEIPLIYYIPGHKCHYNQLKADAASKVLQDAQALLEDDSISAEDKQVIAKHLKIINQNDLLPEFIGQKSIRKIHMAAANGYLDTVKNSYDDINLADGLGKTPLIYAIQNNQEAVVRYLLKQTNLDLLKLDSKNRNALYCAAKYRWGNMLSLLIEHATDRELQILLTDIANYYGTQFVDFILYELLRHMHENNAGVNVTEQAIKLIKNINKSAIESYKYLYKFPEEYFELLYTNNELKAYLEKNITNAFDLALLLSITPGSERISYLKYMLLKFVDQKIDFNKTSMHFIFPYLSEENIIELFMFNSNIKVINSWNFLYYIIKENRTPLLQNLITNGSMLKNNKHIDFDHFFQDKSLLILATQNKNIKMVKFLIQQGAALDLPDNNGNTALHAATQGNNINIVEILLEQGASPDLRNKFGFNPLHIAARNGFIEIGKLLLNNGLDIDANITGGTIRGTALSEAVLAGQLNFVKLLLVNGANPNPLDSLGLPEFVEETPPLIYAVITGNINIVKLLLDNGAKSDIADSSGNTALHFAARYGYTEIVKLLLNTNINIDQNSNNRTALHAAVFKNKIEVVKLLLRSGANPRLFDVNNSNALIVAAAKGYNGIVKVLLEHDLDYIDTICPNGLNALCAAVAKNQLEVVKTLLSFGANPKITCDGLNALQIAVYSGHLEVTKLLLDTDIDLNYQSDNNGTALHEAILRENCDILKLLLERGANPNLLNKNGNTVLTFALWNIKNVEVIKVLINSSDIDVNIPDAWGMTPLFLSAGKGDFQVVDLLLKHGASNDTATSAGFTPLYFSAQNGHLKVVERLLQEKNIDINRQTEIGYTAMHIAAQLGQLEVIELLIANGACLELESNSHKTPLDVAREFNQLDVVEYLESKSMTPEIALQEF